VSEENHSRSQESTEPSADSGTSADPLAMGVLHDLRNALSYIVSNIDPLQQYLADVFELLDVYGDFEEALADDERSQLARFKAAIGIDEVRADLERILATMSLGAARTSSLADELRAIMMPGSVVVGCPASPWEEAQKSLQIFQGRFGPEVQFQLQGEPVDQVNCPGTAFARVLDNLMINAVHATAEREEPMVHVRVHQDAPRKVVSVSVADNGVGISEADQDRIFQPFYTSRSDKDGTGLGLAIVRKIVLDYEGELSLDSSPGEGATYSFSLPVRCE